VLSVIESISGRVGRLPLALYDRQTEWYGPYVHGIVAYQSPTPGLTRSPYVYDGGALQIVSGSEAGIVTGNYSGRVYDLEKLVKDRSCSCPPFVLHSLYGWGSSIQFDGVLLAAIADQDERSVRTLLRFLSRESTGVHGNFARLTPLPPPARSSGRFSHSQDDPRLVGPRQRPVFRTVVLDPVRSTLSETTWAPLLGRVGRRHIDQPFS
jgi:hypothetical protein